MSTTASETRYDFNLSISNPTGLSDSTFTLLASAGVNDAAVLAIYEAIRDAPYDTGTYVGLSVGKSVQGSTNYAASGTPPVFS
jgi:hypothetical protein